jgi:hypothetical protein
MQDLPAHRKACILNGILHARRRMPSRHDNGSTCRRLVNVCLGVMMALAAAGSASAQSGGFPKLANIYTLGSVDPAVMPQLARWDLVVLSSVWTEAQLAQLRSYNPNILILFYIAPYDVPYPADPSDPWEYAHTVYAQTNDLWWYNRFGNPAVDWTAMRMVNITALGAAGPSGNWAQYLEDRIVSLVTACPSVDGIMLDNFYEQLSWNQPNLQLDSDCNPTHNPAGCNGIADTNAVLDTLWNHSLRSMATHLRQRFDGLEAQRARPLTIIGNSVSDYFAWLNGSVHETFPSGWHEVDAGNPYNYNWNYEMLDPRSGYLSAPFSTVPYPASIMNSVWTGSQAQPNRTADFERHKRFTFVSTLMGSGYYSLDAGAQLGNGALWWEQEYDAGGRFPPASGYLGHPRGAMMRIGLPTGPELVANGDISSGLTGWDYHPYSCTGSFSADSSILHSAPAAARIQVQTLSPGGEFKVWKTGLSVVTGGSYTLAFWARASTALDLAFHIYSDDCPWGTCLNNQSVQIGTAWQRYQFQFFSTGTASAALNLFVRQPGTVWLDDVSLRGGDTSVFRRDFDRGVVLLNYTSTQRAIDLGGSYERLRIPGSTEFDGRTLTSESVPPWDGRILLRPGILLDTGTPWVARGKLNQNQPNPFNPGTRIDFQLLAPESVHLAVYDIRGRLVRVLLDAPLPAGDAVARWDGTDRLNRPVHSGVYIYRLETPSFSESKKMTLVR